MLSEAQKTAAAALLDIAFDTFKRPTPIVIYKTPLQTIVSTNLNYNFAYPDNNPDVEIEFTPQTGQFDATIQYIDSVDAEKLPIVANSIKFDKSKHVIRMSVRMSGRALLLDAERIEFDGDNHVILNSGRPRGLFEPNYYDFYLQQEN